jgi:LysM repeat protein
LKKVREEWWRVKIYYTKPGESVGSIAQVKQLAVEEILQLNPHVGHGLVEPGTKLMLPTRQVFEAYPGLEGYGWEEVGLREEVEAFEMRAFHYFCVEEPAMALELGQRVEKLRASANERGKVRKKVRVKGIEEEEHEWSPSVPWINIE